MSNITSTPALVKPKLSVRSLRRGGRTASFSLVEVVIALGIVSFALISILGVMSLTVVAHRDAANDTVLTMMTEAAMQEVRNQGFSGLSAYSGYIYFDQYGQITADRYFSGTTGISYEANTTTTGGGTNRGLPALTSFANTVFQTNAVLSTNTMYQCAITTTQVTLPSAAAVSPSLYLVKLTFSWPISAPYSSQKTNIVTASISNPN